ncbi:MAG: hypothetical protein ACYCXG_05295 [Acidiferrobacter sp.]
MIPLGHALNFYLKYPNEMDYFGYDDEERDVSWLGKDDQKAFLAECEKVCDQAWADFRRLAEAMRTEMQGKLNGIGMKTTPHTKSDNWQWSLDFWPSGNRPKTPKSQVGVYVETAAEGKVAAYPWVWVRGGRRKEDALRKILGVTAAQWSCEFQSGTVPIARIVLGPQKSDRDASPLLDAIMAPLLALKKTQWNQVWKLATSEIKVSDQS